MSTALLQNLISYMGLAACLLFVGMFLRAKVPAFRKLLLHGFHLFESVRHVL